MACYTWLFAFAVALAFTGCESVESVDPSGKEPDTTPDEFGYTPPYTEPKGTIHREDFFPLTPGFQVPIVATFTDTTQYSSLGMDMGTPINESGTKGSIAAFTGRVESLPSRRVTLPSGTYDLMPEVTFLKEQKAGAVEYSDTIFYEKLATAVNMRARASEGSAREEDADADFQCNIPFKRKNLLGSSNTNLSE